MLPSIMSSLEPRKSKRTVIKEGTKKIFHRLFPCQSLSSQRSESSVPSTNVPPSHTRHTSAGEFLKSSASVQDMGKYTICKAGLLSNLYLYIITEGLTKLLINICQHLSAAPNKRNRHSPNIFWLTNYCLILVSYSHTQKHWKKGICLGFCLASVCVTVVPLFTLPNSFIWVLFWCIHGSISFNSSCNM